MYVRTTIGPGFKPKLRHPHRHHSLREVSHDVSSSFQSTINRGNTPTVEEISHSGLSSPTPTLPSFPKLKGPVSESRWTTPSTDPSPQPYLDPCRLEGLSVVASGFVKRSGEG